MRLEIYGVNNLNFVEFNITGDNDTFQSCDKDSLYMDTELFNLFSGSFERSNNIYDYFDPTKYNSRHFVVLSNELIHNALTINKIDSYESFVDFTGSIFLGANFVLELEKIDKNWKLNWELYKNKLLAVNEQLIDVVNKCILEDRILWLVGY